MGQFLHAGWKGGGRPLLWIDFDAYAHTVFAGGAGDWLSDPLRRAATLAQANAVVRSQVVAIDIAAPFIAARGGGDLFGADSPAGYLDTLLDALGHQLSSRADIVLALPSPRDLLAALGTSDDAPASFDALDDIAMGATALLRRLSEKPVSALLLRLAGRTALDGDEAEAVAPLIAMARYYGWAVAFAFTAVAPPGEAGGDVEADLFLYPDADPALLAACADARIGGSLGAAYWSGPARSLPVLPALYGEIPASARPEDVVARTQALAARPA
ncbi:MAG: hypothetical protein KKD25_00645 [Gammaproteobacteria bacterium]|nr:hypothetical protein [Gammaproteobacteria bacterium]MBU0773551.1 hypothetical protein [Gammaproteobacteria bacterium]MBU0857685.1 hypothetical protein [Gammaproteobacteria bacterium]MBU1848101.1 hypothetical protein [Gammaproteobacteria bacterium]